MWLPVAVLYNPNSFRTEYFGDLNEIGIRGSLDTEM